MNQYPQMPYGPQRPVIVRPREPRRRRRFRWWLLWLPAGIAALAWTIRHIEPAATFEEVVRPFRLDLPERLQMLVILGIVAVTICLVARILRNPTDKEDKR